ncbi:hypothetical protein HK101_003040 [Irineochytrium annulatum]|nr:hypothetical protein HK101_003040 [Irineochytrium annulatum]
MVASIAMLNPAGDSATAAAGAAGQETEALPAAPSAEEIKAWRERQEARYREAERITETAREIWGMAEEAEGSGGKKKVESHGKKRDNDMFGGDIPGIAGLRFGAIGQKRAAPMLEKEDDGVKPWDFKLQDWPIEIILGHAVTTVSDIIDVLPFTESAPNAGSTSPYHRQSQRPYPESPKPSLMPPPPLAALPQYFAGLVRHSGVRHHVVVLAIIYLERLRKKLPVHAKDRSISNRLWCRYAGHHFSLTDINLMERQLLALLEFEIAANADDLEAWIRASGILEQDRRRVVWNSAPATPTTPTDATAAALLLPPPQPVVAPAPPPARPCLLAPHPTQAPVPLTPPHRAASPAAALPPLAPVPLPSMTSLIAAAEADAAREVEERDAALQREQRRKWLEVHFKFEVGEREDGQSQSQQQQQEIAHHAPQEQQQAQHIHAPLVAAHQAQLRRGALIHRQQQQLLAQQRMQGSDGDDFVPAASFDLNTLSSALLPPTVPPSASAVSSACSSATANGAGVASASESPVRAVGVGVPFGRARQGPLPCWSPVDSGCSVRSSVTGPAPVLATLVADGGVAGGAGKEEIMIGDDDEEKREEVVVQAAEEDGVQEKGGKGWMAGKGSWGSWSAWSVSPGAVVGMEDGAGAEARGR